MRDADKPYRALVPLYDARTRAAYDVMGRRWRRFQAANAAFRAATPGTPESHALGAVAYRLGRRSTHAYFLWAKGHTKLAIRLRRSGERDAASA